MSRLDRLELSQTAPILENLEKPSAVGSIIPIIAAELDLTSTADTKKIFLEKVLAIHRQLVNNTHLKEDELGVYRNKDSKAFEELSKMINAEVKKLILTDHPQLSLNERSQLQEAVLSEIFGFGPIDTLINNPEYSEIMVNGADQVYVESQGKLLHSGVVFFNDGHVRRIIDRIVTLVGRHIDESSPMVDARLKDGSRVNAIIPPLSLKGSILTIRKFSKKPLTAQNLISFGSMTPAIDQFLEACVRGKLNIIVSGGTGSGKTTLLNVLSAYIPNTDRIITIEDAAELQLNQEHVVSLESRPPNVEGTRAIAIRDLVRNSLRMRPDRIMVGEVRGAEALDMLQAMNTGHDGSMTTAHANTPRDVLSRLETMVLMAGMDLPAKAIRQQIASAFHLIVQQSRIQDGSRKITSIAEVVGMEGDVITTNEIFTFQQEGLTPEGKVRGKFMATGIRPTFSKKLLELGIALDASIFS